MPATEPLADSLPALLDPAPVEGQRQTVSKAVAISTPDQGMLDPAAIKSRMEQTAQTPALDEETRAAQLKAYGEALEALTAASQFAPKAAQFRQELEALPSSIADLKIAIENVPDSAKPSITANTPVPEVEQLLAEYESRLEEIQNERQLAVQAVTESERRLRTLPGLIDQTRQEFAATGTENQGVEGGNGVPPGEAADIRQQARKKMLGARLESLNAELQLLTANSELVSLRRELAEKREKTAEKTVNAWREAVSTYRQSEADREARKARDMLASAHPALLKAAERNAALAEERTSLTRQLQKYATLQVSVDGMLDETQAAFEDVKAKYEAAGETTALGYLMRSYRSQLPDPQSLRQQQRESESAMSEIQLKLLLLKDERDALPLFEENLAKISDELRATTPAGQHVVLQESVTAIRSDRREYLQTLIKDYESHLAGLSNYNFAAGRLLDSRETFAAFIGEHVLWIRSAAPLTSSQELAGATSAVAYLLSPEQLVNLGSQFVATAERRPYEATLLLLLFVAVLVYGRKIRKQLTQLAELSSAQESLQTALRAVGCTLLAASVWPLLVALAAWRLDRLESPTEWSTEFASALGSVAVLLLTAAVIRQLCRDQGVGEVIFGWQPRVTRVIRRSINSAVLLGCPLAFGVKFLETHRDKVWIDSLGRTLFIGGMLLLAWIAHHMLHPRNGVFGISDDRQPKNRSQKLPRLTYGFGLLCPIALGCLAAAGYFFTAEHLAERMMQTLWLGTAIAICVSLGRRWLAVIAEGLERRLHRRKAHELASGAAANSEEPAAVEAVSDAAVSHEAAALEIAGQSSAPSRTPANVTLTPLNTPTTTDNEESHAELIRRQLGRLVNMTATVVLLLGCWSIWSSVLPALGILDRVEFGSSTVVVQKTVTTPEGVTSLVDSEERRPVTLRHAILCIGLIVVTCIAARNLPGLLEALLFQKLPLDSGGRYAATTLSRYAVTTVGWMWALSTIGVTWGSIQWLVAAMTVGLGFGLQEIFGNLVSGLILLFERPVRVGDLVTVGGTTGTVSRMRIRATTITDPDRRELVVPNKKFITNEFINWTLSDPITRVVFKVGVAYGSDTTQVHGLLMDIATSHPLVLDEPAPGALMTGFGDSTLDFELRIFIASRSSYVAVVHELNTTIEREFGKVGIEIAFPQRDLNIRSVNGLEQFLPFGDAAKEKRAA
tara:strand:- start:74946 stop:78509 length:3564 start_codon:yes stop_codon:yes gene_type:complete